MTETLVRRDVDAGVLTLTLDSPKNRNALSTTLVAQLNSGLIEAAENPDVRAVVLTHAGGTFCAGADLSAALASGATPEEASAQGAGAMVELMRSILELPKPVIARIDGHVRAGGFGLVSAADIAIGGAACTFALTESRLGLAPAIISLTVLPRLSSRSASRYFLTGEKFGPEQAVEMGLLTAAADSGEGIDTVMSEVLDGIRKASPQGLAASKALTTESILAAFTAKAALRADESAALFGTDEAREGMTAFLSRRKPAWDLT
ncbi:enoyl-CoA hydratase family protein [Gordonia sp. (in: high G+C Gram-positive bacteria)]|uniref:enoyl-CoA hydratase family protein n=1 Tax=Gordonia sp. (in: high G+C Gram-positive bacteria) TaxID=84139 RepID=UPI001DF4A6EC|nr:enoyl-CoA hydratase family protein [Gordonia sp. (in: high G+C Gram-positive bacteria)]MCB1293409.1 enoyl-CoA hydratase family protein [Gordonia sp. (in: high G+C Gram-positive bacteria)]HMS74741.1 enoyl-CoA hydratase family protein [Gordonia sp. (in: high G+C Gram-positive bacteria)]HQV17071.1 enoyl-CoA hydratase family protein [Gordonia sp. (in: high G+C Gram-positive bacteria)]